MNLLQNGGYNRCYSCYRCQRDGFDKTNPLCCIKDSLSPVLEKAREADVVIIGSPVYFFYPTSETMAFMNRFLFPKLSYMNNAANPDYKVVNPKRIACIFSMNLSDRYLEASGEANVLNKLAYASEFVYGHGESLLIIQTAAFDDYKGLQFPKQFVDSQVAYYKEHFPKDLEKARALGKRLVEEAAADFGEMRE